MDLFGKDFKVTLDERTGRPIALVSLSDPYGMNWIRADYPWGDVLGFHFDKVEAKEDFVSAYATNEEKTLSLTIKRYVKNGRYCEEYVFENVSDTPAALSEKTGIVFPYNDLFDKKENMIHTRSNSHVWCAGDVCNIHSVKLDGQKPYLIQKATEGSFWGYGLLCDICATDNASQDRGYIVLYPQKAVLQCGDSVKIAFEFYFSDDRESISFVSADKYSGFLGEEFALHLQYDEPIQSISAVCGEEKIAFEIQNEKAFAKASFDTLGEKKIDVTVNGKATFIKLNVLSSLDAILEKRVRFITQKQQYTGENERLFGAYLVYDRERKDTHYSEEFSDHNASRERLSMGALVALSLSEKYDVKIAESLKRHRAFIEREILDVKTGYVKNGIDNDAFRLYNYPWVSTYYYEWYRFSRDTECLSIAARVLLKYYELGGAEQESPCIEAFDILASLKDEGLSSEYALLKQKFISHGDSVYRRRTGSTSGEVACANGMMNLMSTFLFQVYLITDDKKYLESTPDLLKISESFYDLQPDFKMYGIALRYWDMFWFGKKKTYGDTYPQWLSALTAQTYVYTDMALGTSHARLIRDNLLGNCCLYAPDSFASCGYLYPKRVTVFTSDPSHQNPYRPLGSYAGERFDEFANDQDWALYYAIKYLK